MKSEKADRARHLLKTTSQRDADIAREVGLSRERIRQLRNQIAGPPPKRKQAVYEKIEQYLTTHPYSSDTHTAKLLEVSYSAVRHVRLQLGLQVGKSARYRRVEAYLKAHPNIDVRQAAVTLDVNTRLVRRIKKDMETA